jgi:hypothetical protein
MKIQRIPSEERDLKSDSAGYQIIPYPADFTLEVLHQKKKDEIRLPDFQRQYVWTQPQASRLIESFLLGLPVPNVYLYKDPDTGKLLVIDGQQRLSTVFAFFECMFPRPEKPFRLVDVREPWNGHTFEELSEKDQNQFKNSVLRAILVDQVDPKDNSSIFHLYERLNTGGTTLHPQEIRTCMYHGQFMDYARNANALPEWRRIFGTAEPHKRMRDVELILRFLALYYDSDNYTKPMKDFINGFARAHRFDGANQLSSHKDLFERTCRTILKHLGERPFRLKAGINVAVCDSVMVAFGRAPKVLPSDLGHRYRQKLLKSQTYLESVSGGTTDEITVKDRLSEAAEILFGR